MLGDNDRCAARLAWPSRAPTAKRSREIAWYDAKGPHGHRHHACLQR